MRWRFAFAALYFANSEVRRGEIMPNAKSLENLKKGRRFTSDADDVQTKKAQSNGGKARARNISIRKLGQQLLNTTPEVGEGTLRQLKQLGLETDKPDLQTLILARIGAMAIGKDSRLALQATQMLMEITGNDASSMIAADDHAIQRERLALEREKMERDTPANGEASCAKIILLPDGGIEVDDGT